MKKFNYEQAFELRAEYSKLFSKDKYLEKMIEAVQSSNEFGADTVGIYSWVRVDLSVYQDCLDPLTEYLSDEGVGLDKQNDAFIYYQGGSIIINEDGDIYDEDSGKFIVEKKDYETVKERNALIEAWMNKSGYFPGVFTQDRYGNVFIVNTMKGSK